MCGPVGGTDSVRSHRRRLFRCSYSAHTMPSTASVSTSPGSTGPRHVDVGVLFAGASGATVALGLSPLVAEAPLIRSLLNRDAVVLSRGAYLAGFGEAAAWLPYALVQQDLAVALWSSSALVAAGTVWVLLTRWRRPPGRPGPHPAPTTGGYRSV